MKYKDKDGKVYDGVMQAIEGWCPCLSPSDVEHCQNCALSIAGGDLTCVEYAADCPRIAARLMGYEVIEDMEKNNFEPVNNTDKLENKSMTRETILEAARKCVCGEREQDYGSPEDNFAIIRELWTTYMNGKAMKLAKEGKPLSLSNADIAAMMALLKIARIATGHAKADNWVDGCGYLACGGEIEGRER